MYLSFEEARRLGGRFYEYEYMSIVHRTKDSEHFGCFKDNNLERFTLTLKIYGWNFKGILSMIEKWNRSCVGQCSMYNYVFLGQTSKESYTPEQVIERIYKNNGFKFLPFYTFCDGIDIIQ